MKNLIVLTACVGCFVLQAVPQKKQPRIIHVARQLRMSRLETPPPKDYFVNMGKQDGLTPGQRLAVYRVTPVVDALSGKSVDFVSVPMGELRVVSVGEVASVARASVKRYPNELPNLKFSTMMIGDRVEAFEVQQF